MASPFPLKSHGFYKLQFISLSPMTNSFKYLSSEKYGSASHETCKLAPDCLKTRYYAPPRYAGEI